MSLLFSGVESIKIPEGNVQKILNPAGDILWQKQIEYKNWLYYGLDYDFTSLYNGIGYAKNYRWSASGKKESPLTGFILSGCIPCNSGDTIRVANYSNVSGTELYLVPIRNNNDGTYVIGEDANVLKLSQLGPFTHSYSSPGYWEFIIDESTFKGDFGAFTHFRISLRLLTDSSELPIITVNQRIF